MNIPGEGRTKVGEGVQDGFRGWGSGGGSNAGGKRRPSGEGFGVETVGKAGEESSDVFVGGSVRLAESYGGSQAGEVNPPFGRGNGRHREGLRRERVTQPRTGGKTGETELMVSRE